MVQRSAKIQTHHPTMQSQLTCSTENRNYHMHDNPPSTQVHLCTSDNLTYQKQKVSHTMTVKEMPVSLRIVCLVIEEEPKIIYKQNGAFIDTKAAI